MIGGAKPQSPQSPESPESPESPDTEDLVRSVEEYEYNYEDQTHMPGTQQTHQPGTQQTHKPETQQTHKPGTQISLFPWNPPPGYYIPENLWKWLWKEFLAEVFFSNCCLW